MRFTGFIGPAYTLDSVNVEAQRCVNLYPEIISSGTSKNNEVGYYRSTPGLEEILTVGTGPIRCVHVDSIGRILVVSYNKVYLITDKDHWQLWARYDRGVYFGSTAVAQGTNVIAATDIIALLESTFITGDQVQVSSTVTLPPPLVAATNYYMINLGTTQVIGGTTYHNYKIATSLANAVAGTGINITGTGSGNLTVTSYRGSADNILDITFSDITYATGNIYYPSHNYYTGMPISFRVAGTLPTEIVADTTYYVIAVDADNFKIASTMANASNNVPKTFTEPAGNWVATELISSTFTGLTQTLSSTSGTVRAASMSLLGDGTDSCTLFVTGTDNYSYYINITGSENDDSDPTKHYRFTINAAGLGSEAIKTGPEASHVAWIDGYFIVNELNTSNFYVSDLQSSFFSTLNFASAEGAPDTIIGLINNYRELWVFGQNSTEIYVDTGNADFPFERIQGGFLEIGCVAAGSIAKINGTVFWLGRSQAGQGIVYAATGVNPQRISTHAIEQTIAGYADMSTAISYTYEDKGHMFYVLNFDEGTWVYDLTTQLWHERAYTNDGDLERHRGNYHAFAPLQSVHVVGDYETNEVYIFSDTTYTDDSNTITRLRSSPHISANLNRVFCRKFQLDMETGVGLDGGVQGSSPQVMLDFSDDNGHTWSSESWALADNTAGSIGDYKTRVIWRRLGSFRDRIFRVQITDPVKVVLLGAELDLEEGNS